MDGVETISIKESPSLVIYPRKEAKGFRYFLVYKLRLFSLSPLKEWSYFVDASTGEIVYSVNDMRDAVNEGYVRKQHYPEHWYDTPVVDGTYVNKHVEITNLLGQHTAHDDSDASGWYTMSWSGAVGSYNIRVLSPPAHSTSWIKIENQWDDVWISNTSLRYDFWTDETNVLYHADWIHGFYSASPFNYSGMDYQMKGYVHQGSTVNAQANGTDIFFGTEDINGDGVGEKFAKSSDVVYHEYTHNVIFHIYSGWIGLSGQAGAMNEGLSDYYACSINNDPILGESVEVFRDLDNPLSYDDEKGIHRNGQVIGGAVWDMRQSPGIGISLADELLFGALERTPRAHDFANLLDNIIYADNGGARLSEGSPHLDDILYAFENHLIYPFDDEVPPAKPKNLTVSAPQLSPRLDWTHNTEPDLNNYKIYRSITNLGNPPGSFSLIGTTSNNHFVDIDWSTGNFKTAHYKIKAVDDSGIKSNYSGTVNIDVGFLQKIASQGAMPSKYGLSQNQPNPFNPETRIVYSLKERSDTKITVYNIMGQKVRTLVDRVEDAGLYEVMWSGRDSFGNTVASGIYIYEISALSLETGERFVARKKMALLK